MPLLLALPFVSPAQTYNSAVLRSNFGVNHLIVRNWNDDYVVSYYQEGDQYFISCSKFVDFLGPYNPGCMSAGATVSDPLPAGISLSDMRILDDKLFFCGHDGGSGNPIVGWLDLNQFIANYFPFNYYDIGTFATLNKLTVFNHNGDYKIAAIGCDTSVICCSSILEMENITTPPIPLQYMQHTMSQSITTERLDDIIFTGSKVVAVGAIDFPYPYFYCSILMFDDLSDFSASTYYNNLFYFNNDPTDLHSQKTVSTLMNKDEIAVAYVHSDPPLHYSTRIRVIDVSSSIPTNTYAQEFDIYDKDEPIEMVYSRKSQKLALLQPVSGVGYPEFVFPEPYQTIPYTVHYTNFPNSPIYNSLDLYHGNNIVSVGEKYAYLQNLPWQTNMGCPNSTKMEVRNINISHTGLMPLTLDSISGYSSLDTLNMISRIQDWKPDCCARNNKTK